MTKIARYFFSEARYTEPLEVINFIMLPRPVVPGGVQVAADAGEDGGEMPYHSASG